MTQKRKSHPSGPHTAHSKRARFAGEDHDINGDAASKAQVDPTYGQRSAFPGLDDTVEEDALFYGPASDGLEYLRMRPVEKKHALTSAANDTRSEAKGVPNLLTAAKPHTPDEQGNPYQVYPQGYYEDGAYVAASFAPAGRNTQLDAETDIDPQEAYYISLITHFHALSSHLRSSIPLSPSNPAAVTTASDLNTAPLKKWRTTFLYAQPTTALLSHLSQEAVINGISSLERYLDWRMLERGRYVGAWAWGLLARCRGVGMMGSEEVGVLRDLGKKARGMVRGMRAGLGVGEEDEQDEDGSEAGEGEEREAVGDGEDIRLEGCDCEDAPVEGDTVVSTPLASPGEDDVILAKQRLLATLQQDNPSEPPDPLSQPIPNHESADPPHPKKAGVPGPAAISSLPPSGEGSSTPGPVAPDDVVGKDEIPLTTRISATLDMIVTIVGEEYGQKDLLDGREMWD